MKKLPQDKFGVTILITEEETIFLIPIQGIDRRIIFNEGEGIIIIHSDDFLLKNEYLGIPFKGDWKTKISEEGRKLTYAQAIAIFREMTKNTLRNTIF